MMISIRHFPRQYPLVSAFAATVILCALALIYVDYSLARFVGTWAGPELLRIFRVITQFGNGGILQAGSFLAAVTLIMMAARQQKAETSVRLRRHGISALYVFVSLISASVVVFAVKELVGRLRPAFVIHDQAPIPENFLDYHVTLSFPSGHSANAFGAAVALGFIFPRQRWIFLIIAALVGLSRIILGMHFLSDVLAGAFIGLAAAVLLRRWFERAGIPVTWQPSK